MIIIKMLVLRDLLKGGDEPIGPFLRYSVHRGTWDGGAGWRVGSQSGHLQQFSSVCQQSRYRVPSLPLILIAR